MRQENDQTYYARRAEQERERANVCEDNTAALVHFQLADEYARRAELFEDRQGYPADRRRHL